jgi:long-chain acyl-CoA synthetase
VRADLQAAVDEVNASVSRAEQVKRYAVLPRDLSQDEGELTPTMKLKRAVIYRRYAAEIDALYESREAASPEPAATAGAAR